MIVICRNSSIDRKFVTFNLSKIFSVINAGQRLIRAQFIDGAIDQWSLRRTSVVAAHGRDIESSFDVWLCFIATDLLFLINEGGINHCSRQRGLGPVASGFWVRDSASFAASGL